MRAYLPGLSCSLSGRCSDSPRCLLLGVCSSPPPLCVSAGILGLLAVCGTVCGTVCETCACARICGSGNVARRGEHEHVGHAYSGRSPESGVHPDHPRTAAERTADRSPGHVPLHTSGPRLAQLVRIPIFRSRGLVVLCGTARVLLHPHLQPEHQDAVHQLPSDGVLPLLRGGSAGTDCLHRRCCESCGRLSAGHCHGVRVPDFLPDDRVSVDHLQRVLRHPSDRCSRLNLKNEYCGSVWASQSNSAQILHLIGRGPEVSSSQIPASNPNMS